jgi:hypothetical protein
MTECRITSKVAVNDGQGGKMSLSVFDEPRRISMTLPTESTLLAEFTYELRPVERGYTNHILYINLDDNTISEKPVTQQMKDLSPGARFWSEIALGCGHTSDEME